MVLEELLCGVGGLDNHGVDGAEFYPENRTVFGSEIVKGVVRLGSKI